MAVARQGAPERAIVCPSGDDATDCAAIHSLDELSRASASQLASGEATFVDDLRALTVSRAASASLVDAALRARQDFDTLRSSGGGSSVQVQGLRNAFRSDITALAAAAGGPRVGTPPPQSVSMADLQAWEGRAPRTLAAVGGPTLLNDVYSLTATPGASTAMVAAARQVRTDFAALQGAERASGGATTSQVSNLVSSLAVDVQNLGTSSPGGQ